MVAANQQLPPNIEIIDPSTDTSVNVLVEGDSFTLRSGGFQPGSVNVTIDSGQSLGPVVAAIQPGDSAASFKSILVWPLQVTGAHSVIAEQSGPPASVSLFVDAIPQ